MRKKTTLLMALIIFLFMIMLWLVYTSKEVAVTGKSLTKTAEVIQKIDKEALGKDYKLRFTKIVNDYRYLLKRDEFSLSDIEALERKMFTIMVPKEYKDLHVNFLFAMEKQKNYLASQDLTKKNESENEVNKIIELNPWLISVNQ